MSGTSFRQGGLSLAELADLNVSAKQVERVVRRIGEERCEQRDAFVEAFLRLPLVEKCQAPAGVNPPELAVVMADGGRLQILDRSEKDSDAATPAIDSTNPDKVALDSATAADAAGQALDWGAALDDSTAADPPPLPTAEEDEGPASEPGSKSQHWRESKVGWLASMSSPQSKQDPCPDIPGHFLQPARIAKLVRELKAKKARTQAAEPSDAFVPNPETISSEDAGSTEETVSSEAAVPNAVTVSGKEVVSGEEPSWDPPKVKHRKVVASRQPWKAFAPILAAAAWSLGFFAAPRRAFVGDGSTAVWGLWRRQFSTFVPILDFIHALSYVYSAALAGRPFEEGWPIYVRWITWVWQGEVSQVIKELRQRQREVGEPGEADKEGSVAKVVQAALTYLENHKGQMKYPDYRRDGLPITSSHVESEIKRINYRVKGTEKFWSEQGAEWILQLRSDYLSDDKPIDAFWEKRQAGETGQRRYRKRQ
jgi:hypothetical protein